ncbi:MAG: hypothetical protein LBV09_03795 [Deferribacteraceae bacterium]|nr:hypothetical protein [Deferribacteraceae bacterium]
MAKKLVDTLLEIFFADRHEFKDLDLTLSRIDDALRSVVPEITAKVVHVAGTNGKGSTSQFIAGLLTNEGFSTLLFTSPHINTIEERIKDNLNTISTELFNELFLKAKPTIEQYNLSFFEAIFLMAMILAGERGYDYIILETGLGGRFDATNTDFIREKLPVITTIAQDHQYILGFKITDILKEKLGIVKDNRDIFVGQNQEFINEMIANFMPQCNIHYLNTDIVSDYPSPFIYNYQLAHSVVEFLLGRRLEVAKLPLPPCRQERFGRVLLDGAHNASGLMTLLKEYKPEIAIVSQTADRDIKKFCDILARGAKCIIITTIPDNPRATNIEKLRKLPFELIIDPIEALNTALNETDGEVLVTGSFYLCGQVREYLLAQGKDV